MDNAMSGPEAYKPDQRQELKNVIDLLQWRADANN
jgi:hypothetical protein